jgi:hypothetical protein
VIATAWKNLFERRRKRAEQLERAETYRKAARVLAAFPLKMRHRAFRAMERRGLRLRVSGAVQVGENVWVAGIQREVGQ